MLLNNFKKCKIKIQTKKLKMCEDVYCLYVKKNTTQLNILIVKLIFFSTLSVRVGLPEAIPIYRIILQFISSQKSSIFYK